MKAREFRLVPTVRKGERRERREKVEPIRPSLLAPLMVEQAKAIQLAKELAAMRPADLERELDADPVSGGDARPKNPEATPAAALPAAAAVVAPERRVSTIWEEAATLRRLLFSANGPVMVAPLVAAPPRAELASRVTPARVPPRPGRGRRRR